LKLTSLVRAVIIANSNNIGACSIGTYILGFKELPPDLSKKWIRDFKYTEELFEKFIQGIYALPIGDYKAALFAPLDGFDRFRVESDGIMLIVNSLQAYLTLVGYFGSTGHRFQISMDMQLAK